MLVSLKQLGHCTFETKGKIVFDYLREGHEYAMVFLLDKLTHFEEIRFEAGNYKLPSKRGPPPSFGAVQSFPNATPEERTESCRQYVTADIVVKSYF